MSPASQSGDALVIFVKAPRPGRVKTRLGPELSAHQACAFYQAMVEDLLARLDGADGPDLVLYHDPPDADLVIADWLGRNRLRCPQPPGDLGTRLRGAFSWAFARGYRRVLAAGSDVPALDRAVIVEALDSLCDNDHVINPSPDGGYSLVGLKRNQPELFENIPWSTPEAFGATLARAGDLGLRTRILPALRDVDTFRDLERLWLDAGPQLALGAPRTTMFLSRLFARPEGRAHDPA